MVEVGFVKTDYKISEGDGTVMVCATIEPNSDVTVYVNLSGPEGTG